MINFKILSAYLMDNPATLYGLMGLIIVIIYYIIILALYGSDPTSDDFPGDNSSKNTFMPPDGLSPAILRYIWRMGFDPAVFAAALLNMAVKGYLRIREDNGMYIIAKGESGMDELSPDEREIAARLDFTRVKEISITPGSQWFFKKALAAFKKYLKTTCHGKYFITNTRYFILGVIFSLFTICGGGYYGDLGKTTMFLLICGWIFIWGLAFIVLLRQAVAFLKLMKGGSGFGLLALLRLFITMIFAIAIIVVEAFSLSTWAKITTPVNIVIVILVILLNILFRRWLKAFTKKGREIADRLEEFRKYLAGRDNGDVSYRDSNVLECDPKLFVRYSPYALALNADKQWGKQFLSKSENMTEGDSVEFTSTFGSSFSGAVSYMILGSGNSN